VFDGVMAEVVSVRLAEEVTDLMLGSQEMPREQKSVLSSSCSEPRVMPLSARAIFVQAPIWRGLNFTGVTGSGAQGTRSGRIDKVAGQLGTMTYYRSPLGKASVDTHSSDLGLTSQASFYPPIVSGNPRTKFFQAAEVLAKKLTSEKCDQQF
jgi:hypothetical protein